jgi:hypothetical protein
VLPRAAVPYFLEQELEFSCSFYLFILTITIMTNQNDSKQQNANNQPPASTQTAADKQPAMNNQPQRENTGQPESEKQVEEGLQNSPEKEMD